MADHVQPTIEELEAQVKKTQEELETAPPVEEDEPDTEIETPEDNLTDESEPNDDGEDLPQKVADDAPTDEPTEEKPQPDEDLKKRYGESTREAQRLYKNNVKMNEAIAEANALPEPTEEELQKEYTDWDDMTDTEKRLSKDSLINKRFREVIAAATAEQRTVDQWEDKVGKYLEDPQTLIDYPELEGKQAKFKAFSGDKKLVGTDFEILVGAFLHQVQKEKAEAPKKKGKMFETGTGGPVTKSTTDKLSIAEAAVLKRTNYNEYKTQLLKGNIETEI